MNSNTIKLQKIQESTVVNKSCNKPLLIYFAFNSSTSVTVSMIWMLAAEEIKNQQDFNFYARGCL